MNSRWASFTLDIGGRALDCRPDSSRPFSTRHFVVPIVLMAFLIYIEFNLNVSHLVWTTSQGFTQ